MNSEEEREKTRSSTAIMIPSPEFLDLLSNQERYVAETHLLNSAGDKPTLEEIGKALGITKQRVRQIEDKILKTYNEYKTYGQDSSDPAILLLPIPKLYRNMLINRGFHKLSDIPVDTVNHEVLLDDVYGIGKKTIQRLKGLIFTSYENKSDNQANKRGLKSF